LGEDENVDEVVNSLENQRRAIVSSAQDAQAKGDQASFYKFTDALAAHDNQYFKSSDPDVIAQRADLVQNVEAAQTAADYLEYSSFSRQGLLDQLLYEGFTPSEAEYGVSYVGY
jgi:hypothetical protein